jgi:hypothetical protein
MVSRSDRINTSPAHDIRATVAVGHVVLPNRARRAVLARRGPRLSRVRSSRARAAGTDQPSRKGASRADHAGTESSSGIVPDSTRRANAGPLGGSQAVPARLASYGTIRVGWEGVGASQAILARGSAGLACTRRIHASLAGSAALGAISSAAPVGPFWTRIGARQDDHGGCAITSKSIQGCHLYRAQGLVVDPEVIKRTNPRTIIRGWSFSNGVINQEIIHKSGR